MDSTTRRVTAIGLAIAVVATVYTMSGDLIKAVVSLVLAAPFLLWGFWPDLRRLWTRKPAPAPEERDYLEVVPVCDEEDHIGLMPASRSDASLQIPSLTVLSGDLLDVHVINHSETFRPEILSMRLALFDIEANREIRPAEVLRQELNGERRIPPGEHRHFGFGFSASFEGFIPREDLCTRVFLMVKATGRREERKIPLDARLFS